MSLHISSNNPSPESLCMHQDTVLDIDGSSMICRQCGLVLDERMPVHTPTLQQEAISKEVESLWDILDRLHVSSVSFFDCCLSRYRRYQEKAATHKPRSCNQPKKKDLMACAIWYTITQQQIGISPEELCRASGTLVSSLWKTFQGILEETSVEYSSDIYLSHISYYLGLSFKQQGVIRLICQELDEQLPQFKPSNICAAAIVIYCKKVDFPLSLRQICKETSSSPTSVTHIVRLYNNKK